MATTHLEISNVGQIEHADLTFGDLTVLVGPQATGKSIALQLLRLLQDTGLVLSVLKDYGLIWNKDLGSFLDIYLGEGMRNVWSRHSKLTLNGEDIDLSKRVSRQHRSKTESMFFIPAQRVLTIGRGWPRPFTDYSSWDPYCVRDFSEKLRRLLETSFGREQQLFPQSGRLKREFREQLRRTIFSGFGLYVDDHSGQKRLVLRKVDSKLTGRVKSLPVMVWSAGQREFVPLLLGYYWLCPGTKVSRRGKLDWVVIEEPEAGLHPKAISTVLLLVLELLWRGYKVCLSTHSPHVLDVVWALRTIREYGADSRRVLEIFGLESTGPTKAVADAAIKKDIRVYLFDADDHRTKDISELDPGSDDAAVAGWGGLTEFSGRVGDVVASVVANGNHGAGT